jgi:hypothetical protein
VKRRHAGTTSGQAFNVRRHQELAQKQRIPPGQLATRRAERLIGVLVELRAHDRANGGCAQWPERHPADAAIADELHKLAPLATVIPQAQTDHQRHPQISCSARQITKPCQRRIISPLHIVDRHHQRAALGPIRTKPIQPVNRRELIPRRLPLLNSQRPRAEPRHASKQPTSLTSSGRAQHRFEQLTRNPERDLLL